MTAEYIQQIDAYYRERKSDEGTPDEFLKTAAKKGRTKLKEYLYDSAGIDLEKLERLWEQRGSDWKIVWEEFLYACQESDTDPPGYSPSFNDMFSFWGIDTNSIGYQNAFPLVPDEYPVGMFIPAQYLCALRLLPVKKENNMDDEKPPGWRKQTEQFIVENKSKMSRDELLKSTLDETAKRGLKMKNGKPVDTENIRKHPAFPKTSRKSPGKHN